MVLGVISIIAGVVIAIATITKDVSSVQQQTVQYLGFIWASLFVIGGFIIITIKKSLSENNEQIRSYPENIPVMGETKHIGKTKICPSCSEEVKLEAKICKYCRYEFPKPEEKPINNSNEKTDYSLMSMTERKDEYDRLKSQFDGAVDETEKKFIAQKLYDLGYQYYGRYL